MAERRMLAKKIIDSAKFLKMPSSSRLLYFDLAIRADDDGIVEAFNVIRMTGASEDDLKILAAKEYIKVLNEDLVAYVVDWTEHNRLRADRKIDSMYKDLLLRIIPDVQLLEAKQRADRKKIDGTSQGQPMDCLVEGSIGKDSLGEESIGKVSLSSSSDEASNEEEGILEVMRICQKIKLKLKKVDAIDFVDIYGITKVKQALISIKHSTSDITSPSAYLASILQDISRDKKVEVNINNTANKNSNNGTKFSNHEQRESTCNENDLIGWDE